MSKRFSITASAVYVVVVGVAVACGTGCQAEAPDNYVADSGVAADASALTQSTRTDCQNGAALTQVSVDQLPATTSRTTLIVRGDAPGAQLISAQVLSSNAKKSVVAPQALASDGRFCLQIPLTTNATNTITVTAIDHNGCPGSPTTITVRQRDDNNTQTSKPSTTEAPETANLAPFAQISASKKPQDDKPLTNLIDRSVKTTAKFKFWDPELKGSCNRGVWVRFDFGQLFALKKAVLRWKKDVGDDYARCYKLLVSTEAKAATPDLKSPDGAGWRVVKSRDDANHNTQTIELNDAQAQSVALLLHENGGRGAEEAFELAEVELIGYDPLGGDDSTLADRCD